MKKEEVSVKYRPYIKGGSPSFKTAKNPVIKNVPSTKAQKQFILDWLTDNQEHFDELMQQALKQDPRLWLMVYMNMHKHTVPQDRNVNVNVGINKDFLELQAMAKTNAIADNSASGGLPTYTQYEEIVAEENKEPIQTAEPYTANKLRAKMAQEIDNSEE